MVNFILNTSIVMLLFLYTAIKYMSRFLTDGPHVGLQ